MNAKYTRQVLVKILLSYAIIQLSCIKSSAASYQCQIPEKTNDGWQCAWLGSVGFDTNLIQQLLERIGDNTYTNIHSILLVRNDKLVVEEYFSGQNSAGQFQAFTWDTLHEMHSATKSVNSILVGIAIDQHLIHGVDEKISHFFPEYSGIFSNKDKAAICLKDLLSMTAGLSWDEWTFPYSDPRNDAAMMAGKADFFQYILEKPVAVPRGKKFVYNSGISLMLGEIVHKASGLPVDKFAERYLFSPLGIAKYSWQKAPNGVVNTLGGLCLRPRDMAKIGQLFLDGGRWNGKQIVSEQWVQESVKERVGSGQLQGQIPSWFSADGYGYQWWLGSFRVRDKIFEFYFAGGRGGQFVIAIPELQLVAVFTGWNDNASLAQPFDMLKRYVLPAVNGSVSGK